MKHVLSVVFIAATYFSSISQSLLTPEKLWELKRISGSSISPDGNFLLFSQKTYSIEQNSGNADLYVINLKTNGIIQLTNTKFSEFEAQWTSSNTIWFLSTESGTVDIWKMNADGSNKTQVSDFKTIEIEGFKVAADESSLLTLQAVNSKKTVNEIYTDLPKANVRIEDDLMYRHWDHWDDYSKRHIFYHPINQNKIAAIGKDLQLNEPFDAVLPPFGGMEQVSYSPDFKHVIYTSKKKSGKEFATSTNSELYSINVDGTNLYCLTQNGFDGYDINPTFSSQGDFAFLSMARNGFESDKNDIIVQFQKTNEFVNITKNVDLSVADYKWHADGKRIFFIAVTKGTKQLFSVDVFTKAVTQLTQGQHDFTEFNLLGETIYASRQSMLEPGDLYAITVSKSKKGLVSTDEIRLTNVNKEIMDNLAKPTVQEKWITTTDGKKMLVWMILPPNFDESKKYPTLLYCQGGPQSAVSQFFSYRWNFMLMASQGYIVVAPNRRGLPGFGQEWNDAISKDWGGQAMQDYLAAIDSASQLPYVDKDNLGAIGASYGGYSVYYLAGIHNNRFKTFVSHCGLFNLESWYGTTEELFFANWDIGGPYWKAENKEMYAKNSPHNYVKNWNTPILVIHGGMDFRVPESEGMQAFQAAQLMGIKSKYLYFPKEGHWVLSPQNGLVWHREFFKWLNDDLKH